MGMRIGGAGNAWASQQSTSINQWQQKHQNFKSLKTAIQNNDLTGAQQAFAAISASNPGAVSNANSPLAQLGQALQAGNMPAAQQLAQSWRSAQEGKGAPPPPADANAAVSSFLQTLSASSSAAGASATATNPDNATSSSGTATAASSPEQIAQALLSFEKNLFDSLQIQNKSNAQGTASPLSQPPADTGAAATPTAGLPQALTDTQPPTPHQHHHHGGHGGGSQLGAQLSALMAQTSQAASTGTAGAPGAANGLDQSFKSLLSTLGVTGNNASLNTFLQSMSSSLQA
jgi:hypothetical protein